MPKSHDAKPRNKARRTKFQREMNRGRPVKLSLRALHRRFLHQQAMEMAAAQKNLEISLRKLGIAWRAVEQARRTKAGTLARMDREFFAKLLRDRGLDVPEEMKAA